MHPMQLILASLVLLTFASLTPAQAPPAVHLFADLQPGWSERYELRSRIELRGDDDVTDLLKQTVTLRIAAVAREEGGAAAIRATFESVDISLTSAGDTQRFILPAPEVPEHDDAPALARIYTPLLDAVLEFEIQPSGSARLTSGLDTAMTAAQNVDPDNPARLLGIFTSGALERAISGIITLDPHREPRGPGDAWREMHTVPVIGRRARLITDYTLRDVQNDHAEVQAAITVDLLPPEAPTPTQPRVSIAEQSGEITAIWDARQNRLVSRQSDTHVVWAATLATDPPIQSRITATSQLKITLLTEPAPPR